MKKMICENQDEAITWANAGRLGCQREAFWAESGKAWRAERNTTDVTAVVNSADGLWWSATKTVRQKLGLDK